MVTKAEIIKLLETNDKAVGRALVVLTERQTLTEKSAEQTINRNGEGFTPADARMGTSMSKYFTRNGFLTPKQLAYWRKPNVRGVPRICKYASQLLEIAQAKAQAARMMEPAAVGRYEGQDLGNLLEERMVIQEQLDAFQEGSIGNSPEQDYVMEALVDRLNRINVAISLAHKNEYGQQGNLLEQQTSIQNMQERP